MLHIHRAERADGLIEALRSLLVDPLADPFAPEVIAVPTRGKAIESELDDLPAEAYELPEGESDDGDTGGPAWRLPSA